ncbi:uncharacterized protein LOC116805847 [Drosophila grimshawi]|uniref:uncharacterized protein LOC116805847 n=1 Tax=Drosophila grimshawi TaxID=7222 RepID=UPI000C86F421|nr:uncharacterized protein LOC116805847 [Drosophila grimshawi]
MPAPANLNISNELSRNEYRLARIYIVAAAMTLIALGQLTAFRIVDMTECVPMPSFMWLVIAMVCKCLLIFMELFDKFPVNWTLGFVAVESMTLCVGSYYWPKMERFHTVIVVFIVIGTNFCLYLMGTFLPVFILPSYNFMLVLTIVFVIVYIFLIILLHSLSMRMIFVLAIEIWTILYLIPLMLYASTLIQQRRLVNMMSQEYMLSATIITTMFLYMLHVVTSIVLEGVKGTLS